MNSAGNVLAEVVGQGEHGNSRDDESKPESVGNHKELFLAFKARQFLCHALDPGTPEAVALANGVQFVLFLRSKNVRADRLELSIKTGGGQR
jgi:hypothetical protein